MNTYIPQTNNVEPIYYDCEIVQHLKLLTYVAIRLDVAAKAGASRC